MGLSGSWARCAEYHTRKRHVTEEVWPMGPDKRSVKTEDTRQLKPISFSIHAMVSHAMYQLFPIFNSNTKNATLKSNPNSMLPAY